MTTYICNGGKRFAVASFNINTDSFAIISADYLGAPNPGTTPIIGNYLGASIANYIVIDTILHVAKISSSNVHFAFVTNNTVRQLLYCASGNWSNANNFSFIATTNNIAIASLTANNFQFI